MRFLNIVVYGDELPDSEVMIDIRYTFKCPICNRLGTAGILLWSVSRHSYESDIKHYIRNVEKYEQLIIMRDSGIEPVCCYCKDKINSRGVWE